jgi:hypothetical protein
MSEGASPEENFKGLGFEQPFLVLASLGIMPRKIFLLRFSYLVFRARIGSFVFLSH